MSSIAKRKRTISIEEKSKRKKDAKTSYNLGSITIGSEVVRWRDFQRQHKFRSNEETARFLLDHISSCGKKVEQKATTSTPFKTRLSVFEPPVSGISSISSEAESVTTITATEGKSSSDDQTTMTAPGPDISHAGGTEVAATCTTVPSVRKKGHGILSNPKFASFTEPFNLSMDVTNIEDEDEDEDDSDYEPSFSFEAVLPDDVNQNYEEAAFEEEAFGKDGCDDDADAEEESADDDPCPGIQRLKTEADSVHLIGDGRNDSPGHSAQYCSYTMMEYDSKKILTLRTLDKRSTDRKSTNMEKVGFEQALQELTDNNIAVEEVVTDAHLGIGSIMNKKYPEIKHSHYIWHAAKKLAKRLGKIVKKKANQI
ncbi:uncharacterized protein LOC127865697 [Dreissena polymorpha]|uniref:uncharacterized protein LOC127865697 n=1 Tax=Dreissena polymorpha TaxID=45954 RepID=UPI0022650F9E|nr:uncharacterized protein LOC127865697 [Dreissena polymorpha]